MKLYREKTLDTERVVEEKYNQALLQFMCAILLLHSVYCLMKHSHRLFIKKML